jgi:hypothetical protein
MVPTRFSVKLLLLSFAAIAAFLAVPAWFITQIRNEASAAKRIIALGHEDVRQAEGVIAIDAVSYSLPRGQVRPWLYKVAGSPGEVDTVTVLGDESAGGITALARWLPNVGCVNVRPAAATPGEFSLITQSQIDAVSCFESIELLEFYGRFDRGFDFQSWSRIKRIGGVEITSDFIPPGLVEQLGPTNVKWLTIYCRYDWELDIPPSAEAFSFEKIPCSNVIIAGLLDDRALELISRAPHLHWLEFRCGSKHNSPQVTDAGIRRACQNLHVRHLSIQGAAEITEPTAEVLASIRELQSVEISLSPAARERLFALRPELRGI